MYPSDTLTTPQTGNRCCERDVGPFRVLYWPTADVMKVYKRKKDDFGEWYWAQQVVSESTLQDVIVKFM